jgi:hypothetical protein
MAKLVFQLSQSLDGYVDHQEMEPGPALFRHFVERTRALAGGVWPACLRAHAVLGESLSGTRINAISRPRGGVSVMGCVTHVDVGRTRRLACQR